MPFPVVHSTLDPQALAREAAERYALASPVRCRLVARGSNDVYSVDHAAGRFALRVARARFRTADETRLETDFLRHLAMRGLAVPQPIDTATGAVSFELDAPEGARQVRAFTWATGSPRHPLTTAGAREAGHTLARLHELAADFPGRDRRRFNVLEPIAARRPLLTSLLAGSPLDGARVDAAIDRLADFVDGPLAPTLPSGMTHGDFQPANLLFVDDTQPTVIDFDDCGRDLLLKDLACFLWRNRFDAVDRAIDEAFLAGYESQRPLATGERAALPLLVLSRNLYIASACAVFIDRLGPIPGFDSPERFVELLEVDRDGSVA